MKLISFIALGFRGFLGFFAAHSTAAMVVTSGVYLATVISYGILYGLWEHFTFSIVLFLFCIVGAMIANMKRYGGGPEETPLERSGIFSLVFCTVLGIWLGLTLFWQVLAMPGARVVVVKDEAGQIIRVVDTAQDWLMPSPSFFKTDFVWLDISTPPGDQNHLVLTRQQDISEQWQEAWNLCGLRGTLQLTALRRPVLPAFTALREEDQARVSLSRQTLRSLVAEKFSACLVRARADNLDFPGMKALLIAEVAAIRSDLFYLSSVQASFLPKNE